MGRPKGAKDKKPRVVKPTGQRRGLTAEPVLEEGYNSRFLRFMREIIPTEPLDYSDVDEMERRFARYLRLCEEHDMKVGNMAAYTAIGINKALVYEWLHRGQSNPRRLDFIKKMLEICSMYREGLMADGKINPVTGIFWQKNYDGMRDQQEVVVTPNNPMGEAVSADALRQKYLDTTYGVSEIEQKEPLPALAEIAESTAETVPTPDGTGTEV